MSVAERSEEKENEEKADSGLRLLVRRVEDALASGFVGREEEARVAVLALLTKNHAVFIGPPGVAKSALIFRLSQLVSGRFFYFLLSKYTTPDELIGPIDPIAYKNGRFVRNVDGRLVRADIAFIDEIFKGSSETLNAILNIMNERKFVDADGTVYQVPLYSLFGASNESPSDSDLGAFYDRFLLRHFVKPIDLTKIEETIIHNATMRNNRVKSLMSLKDIDAIYDRVSVFLENNISSIAKVVSQLVSVLRQNGIFISDRTAVSFFHLPRLVATYSYVYETDIRKAAIIVSKYVLPNEESIENYRKALDQLIPPALREANEKLEKARDSAASGNIAEAKRYAAEALQMSQSLLSDPSKASLYKDDIKNIIRDSEEVLKKIMKFEEELKSFRKTPPMEGS
ncbi:MAG: AAA family ATPase [Thermoprotei archaeon]